MTNPDVDSSRASTEKAAARSQIDYALAMNDGLQLVPVGDGAKALAEDCARMFSDDLLLEEAKPFDALMAHCANIAARADGSA